MTPQLEAIERRCLARVHSDPPSAYKECASVLGYLQVVNGGIDNSDIRQTSAEANALNDEVEQYLNRADVQTALNIDEHQEFKMMNMTVYDWFILDGLNSYTHLYDDILKKGVPVFILDGNFDVMDGPVGTEAWMSDLTWDKMSDFHETSRQIYKIGDRTAGYYKSKDNLSFLVVHGAGHLVPST